MSIDTNGQDSDHPFLLSSASHTDRNISFFIISSIVFSSGSQASRAFSTVIRGIGPDAFVLETDGSNYSVLAIVSILFFSHFDTAV